MFLLSYKYFSILCDFFVKKWSFKWSAKTDGESQALLHSCTPIFLLLILVQEYA